MRCYAINASNVVNGTDLTILGLTTATTVRPRIYDVVISSRASPPNDYAAEYTINRYTATGTAGSSVTPQAIDPADPASLCSAGIGAYSPQPTYTAGAILLNCAVNLRATFRWVAYPGRELVLPATTNNGAGLKTVVATTAYTSNATILFEE